LSGSRRGKINNAHRFLHKNRNAKTKVSPESSNIPLL
jgi:hypothetical protein